MFLSLFGEVFAAVKVAYVGADALTSARYLDFRDDVGIVPYKPKANLIVTRFPYIHKDLNKCIVSGRIAIQNDCNAPWFAYFILMVTVLVFTV